MTLEAYPILTKALKESDAGKSLLDTYRWSSGGFRSNESNETWEKVFGATAIDFKHGLMMYHIGVAFLKYEPGIFTQEQESGFLYGLFGHDFGEAKINGAKYVGDISAQNKTAKDEAAEEKVAYKVIRSLKLPDYLKSALRNGYKKTVEGEDKEINFVFRALEKNEYVITAMKVYQNNKKLRAQGLPAMDPEMEKALIGRVLIIDLPKVLEVYIPKFPDSIGKLFRNAAPLIDEMFAYSLPWLESHDTWGVDPTTGKPKPVDHKGLAEAFRVKWEAFKAGTV